jgi:hypothetical protein
VPTYPGIPPEFAYPAAFGDLVAAALALIAIPLVANDMKAARPMVWIVSIEGTLDLWVAITLCDVLRRAAFHGAGILDPRVLGARAAGNALHYVRHSAELLAEPT